MLAGPVVLVLDLAHDLLDDVLDGDDADGAAVLVDDHRELHPGLLHLAEEVVDALGFRHIGGRAHERAQVGAAAPRRKMSMAATTPTMLKTAVA